MTDVQGRQPPRFVPTLTDILTVHSADAQLAPIPTLHDEVAVEALPPSMPDTFTPQTGAAVALGLQARVMARLDDALEERLRYALAEMVQLHTRALYESIRVDLEKTVSAAVHEAVAQELAAMRGASSQ